MRLRLLGVLQLLRIEPLCPRRPLNPPRPRFIPSNVYQNYCPETFWRFLSGIHWRWHPILDSNEKIVRTGHLLQCLSGVDSSSNSVEMTHVRTAGPCFVKTPLIWSGTELPAQNQSFWSGKGLGSRSTEIIRGPSTRRE